MFQKPMFYFVVAASSMVMSPVASAVVPTSVPVLIGTYTAGTSQGIYLYRFDTLTGTFGTAPVQVTQAENPSWLLLSADHRKLYAVAENGPGQGDIVGRVSAYDVAPRTGELSLINTVQSLGSEPAHASLSADGRYLFVSNYSVLADPGGTLAVLPVLSNGSLAPVVQVKTSRASQVDPERQKSPHVHSSVQSPDGRYVFVQDLGADLIHVYRYDAAIPEAPLSMGSELPAVNLPPGSGPRHLVFAGNGKHAYLTLEMAGKVVMFDYADGVLTQKQVLPLAADDFHGEVAAGAIHLAPDDGFLYVADRGDDNQIAAFKVDKTSGRLTLIGRRSVEGKNPREFALDPTGRFLVVANQQSGQLVVFHRDPSSGLIGARVQVLAVDQPADITFVVDGAVPRSSEKLVVERHRP